MDFLTQEIEKEREREVRMRKDLRKRISCFSFVFFVPGFSCCGAIPTTLPAKKGNISLLTTQREESAKEKDMRCGGGGGWANFKDRSKNIFLHGMVQPLNVVLLNVFLKEGG
jgi:hypothetical protein